MKSILFPLLIGTILVSFVFSGGEAQECRNERHRPQLHFTAPDSWLNDPNGLFYLDGEYHMYYQLYPYNVQPGPKHWGHAVSTDLVSWTDMPIALYPDELGEIYSGSAVVDFENSTGFQESPTGPPPVVAMYTSAGASQVQSIAYSLNKGRDFVKYPGNPVIPNPGIVDFRDPKVLRHEDKWVMVLAVWNRVHFYESKDLKTWEFLSEFGQDQGSHGGTWECSDLLRIENEGSVHWVLMVSTSGGAPNGGSFTQYFVGNFDGRSFISSQVGARFIEWGEDNYASVSFFNDPKGRSLIIGWMTNLAYAQSLPTQHAFLGQMTLPRVLTLTNVNGELRLRSSLPEEFQGFRVPSEAFQLPTLREIPRDGVWAVGEELGFKKELQEVELAFNIAGIRGASSLSICFVNSLRQELCFGYDHERAPGHEIFLNREKTGDLGLISGAFVGRQTGERVARDEGIITFRAVLDVDGIELFVDNGLTTMSSLFFPDQVLNSLEIRHHAFSDESVITLINGRVQGLRSMYDCSV